MDGSLPGFERDPRIIIRQSYKRTLLDYFICNIKEINYLIDQFTHHLAQREPVELEEIQSLRQELDEFVGKNTNQDIPDMIFDGKYQLGVMRVIVQARVAKCWHMANEIIDLMIDGFRCVDIRTPSPDMFDFSDEAEISGS